MLDVIINVVVGALAAAAAGYIICKVVDVFCNGVATRHGYTQFFVRLLQLASDLVKVIAQSETWGGRIESTDIAWSELSPDVQRQIQANGGECIYEYRT